MEASVSGTCPRCGDTRLNIYFSDKTDERLGVLCQTCNLKAYYLGNDLVPLNS